MWNEKNKKIILEQLKNFGIRILEIAGEVIIKTAKELKSKSEDMNKPTIEK